MQSQCRTSRSNIVGSWPHPGKGLDIKISPPNCIQLPSSEKKTETPSDSNAVGLHSHWPKTALVTRSKAFLRSPARPLTSPAPEVVRRSSARAPRAAPRAAAPRGRGALGPASVSRAVKGGTSEGDVSKKEALPFCQGQLESGKYILEVGSKRRYEELVSMVSGVLMCFLIHHRHGGCQ